ncbi:zinc-binding alcohol dehydrogenase family protein [Deinococcus sp. UYEF24]
MHSPLVPNNTHLAPNNTAAWFVQDRPGLEVGPIPYTPPRAGELVVRTHAVAVNPVDWLIPIIRRFAYPWLKSPAVLGLDLAGEVVEVGPDVTRFRVGDRVLALAVGTEKSRNTPAEGAFQHYAVVLERLTCPLPGHLTYEQGAVLPLGLSTAACGLFQKDQLALRHPSTTPVPTGQTLLIWGGATSVGNNAIQLAVAAGYEVVTTASPRNFEHVRALGASQVFDYRSETVVQDLIAALQGKTLAGALSLASGATGACMDVLRECQGRKFVSMASTPVSFELLGQTPRPPLLFPRLMGRMLGATALLQLKARRAGIQTKSIWGGSLMDDEVGPLMFETFLPAALAERRYLAAPEPEVIGHGLGAIQQGLEVQRRGVSARKVVISQLAGEQESRAF